MKRMLTLVWLLVCTLCSKAQLNHQGLDPSFGTNGLTITAYQNDATGGGAVAVQSDGKIIVGGRCTSGALITRYNPNGLPDVSFGTNGLLVRSGMGYVDNVLIQADSKIIIGGCSIMRLMPNGEVDSTFGTAGQVIPPHCEQQMVLQSDGKLLVGGVDSVAQMCLIRYLQNGMVDSTFGVNGIIIDSRYIHGYRCQGLAVTPDGHIITSGVSYDHHYTPSISGIAVTKYLNNGMPDTSFNDGGIFHYADYTRHITTCNTLSLQPDGKILLAGGTPNWAMSSDGGFIMRLNADDSLDNSFGRNGIFELLYYGLYFYSIEVRTDGTIITGGNVDITTFAVASIKPDGSAVNASFGRNGIIFTQIGGLRNSFGDLKLQPDNKIILAGGLTDTAFHDRLVTLRYLPDAPTGVEEIAPSSSSLQLSPNPARNLLHLSASAPFNRADIIPLDGRLSKSYSFSLAASAHLPLGDLPPGVYTLKIYFANGQPPAIEKLLISQ